MDEFDGKSMVNDGYYVLFLKKWKINGL